MTNIKKMLGAGLAVATLFGFAACGSSTNNSTKKAADSAPVQLTVWGSAYERICETCDAALRSNRDVAPQRSPLLRHQMICQFLA